MSVLDIGTKKSEGVHFRLIMNEAEVCLTAGVQSKFLHESMGVYCSEDEIDYVRHFKQKEKEGQPGLVLVGGKNVDSRCQAIAAAFVRNFIDARVIPMNSLLERTGDGLLPHVLVVPNLYISQAGKGLPAWKIQGLYDLLLQRSVQGLSSVVYVQNLSGMLEVYGAPFADFLSQFKIVKG
jgi:hypothetical protein